MKDIYSHFSNRHFVSVFCVSHLANLPSLRHQVIMIQLTFIKSVNTRRRTGGVGWCINWGVNTRLKLNLWDSKTSSVTHTVEAGCTSWVAREKWANIVCQVPRTFLESCFFLQLIYFSKGLLTWNWDQCVVCQMERSDLSGILYTSNWRQTSLKRELCCVRGKANRGKLVLNWNKI